MSDIHLKHKMPKIELILSENTQNILSHLSK